MRPDPIATWIVFPAALGTALVLGWLDYGFALHWGRVLHPLTLALIAGSFVFARWAIPRYPRLADASLLGAAFMLGILLSTPPSAFWTPSGSYALGFGILLLHDGFFWLMNRLFERKR